MQRGFLDNSPINRLVAQKSIGLRKMPAAKETPTGRKRRWVRCRKDQMVGIGQQMLFRNRFISPKHKNDFAILFVKGFDDLVGEMFPPLSA